MKIFKFVEKNFSVENEHESGLRQDTPNTVDVSINRLI